MYRTNSTGIDEGPIQTALLAIGEQIRCRREEAGWSQEELAEQAEVTRNTISNIENALSVVRMDNFLKIANCLEVSPSTLLSPEGVTDPSDDSWEDLTRLYEQLDRKNQKITCATVSTLVHGLIKAQ